MPPMDEENVLNMLEKASRSVVNTSTMKLVQNLFYQAVPLGGIGSGTIIDSNGLILTDNHVVGAPRKHYSYYVKELFDCERQVIGH